jgi:Zn-dependent protease with chaperone function
MVASKLWPKPDEWRRIWIDVVKTAILAVGPLALALWGWWTNKLSLWVAVACVPAPLPLWMLLLLVIGSGLFLFHAFRPYLKPAYVRRYLKDTLDHITWVWGYNEKYEIVDPLPLCPTCQTELILTPVPGSFTLPGVNTGKTVISCPSCNTGFEIVGTLRLKEDHALPKIRQRIRTGEWAKPPA